MALNTINQINYILIAYHVFRFFCPAFHYLKMTLNQSIEVDRAAYYNLESFDQSIWLVLAQIIFLVYVQIFVSSVDVKIIKTVWHNAVLHIPANVILCVILSVDVFTYGLFVLGSAVMLFQDRVWLNPTLCRLMAGYFLCIAFIINILLTIAGAEKFTYIIFPFKHVRIFSMKKTAVYMLISSISLILYFAIYSATSTVYFSANILSCYTDDMDDVLILLYVLPVCVNTTFHAAIFIFAIRKRRQIECKWNTFEHNVNSRMFRNALTLFVITAMNFVCCFLYFSVMNIQMYPVITRVFYIYINVAIPILNPLVVLLGNRQIRKKAIGLKKFQTSNKINCITTINIPQSADAAMNNFGTLNVPTVHK